MNKLLLAFLLLLTTTLSYANFPVKHLVYEKQPVETPVYFRTGSVGHIDIPLQALKGSRISSAGGLVFLLQDGTHFSMESLTGTKAGFKGVDMHGWPEYLFGLKTRGKEPQAYITDLLKSKQIIIKKQIDPYEIRVFETSRGKGYWAVGKKRSSLIFIDHDIKDQILWFFTTGLSEEKIFKLIINGVL